MRPRKYILQCPTRSAVEKQTDSLADISKQFKGCHTCPDMSDSFIQAMYQWRKGEVVTRPGNLSFDGVMISQKILVCILSLEVVFPLVVKGA